MNYQSPQCLLNLTLSGNKKNWKWSWRITMNFWKNTTIYVCTLLFLYASFGKGQNRKLHWITISPKWFSMTRRSCVFFSWLRNKPKVGTWSFFSSTPKQNLDFPRFHHTTLNRHRVVNKRILMKNLYRKFWSLGGDFHPDPLSQEENLKILEGTTICPSGISKSPIGAKGIWLKIHDQKPEFCTYFFLTSVWYTGTAAVACDTSIFTRILHIFFPICWY